jgi:predicted metalloprotease with PDZ domain
MSARRAINSRLRQCCGLCFFLYFSLASSRATTSYLISLEDPDQHLVEVQILLPEGPAVRELQLPVWNALYQIRDFAQYVNWVRAKDRAGRPLSVRKLDRGRWQITGAHEGASVAYQMFVDSPGPFGAQLNSHHAFLNLAQILMYPVDARGSPLGVRFNQLPEGWHVATPLTVMPDGSFSAKITTG